MAEVEDYERCLVEKAKRQDKEAIAQIYSLYVDKIFKYIFYKVGNKAEAEDLTEQVFIKAIEALPRFSWKNVPVSAWLFSIARNQVIDHYRSKGREVEIDIEKASLLEDIAGDPYASALTALTREKIFKALRSLTEDQQQVICLKFFSGLSNTEIASLLSKTEGAIKSIQHRGLRALRKLLGIENYE